MTDTAVLLRRGIRERLRAAVVVPVLLTAAMLALWVVLGCAHSHGTLAGLVRALATAAPDMVCGWLIVAPVSTFFAIISPTQCDSTQEDFTEQHWTCVNTTSHTMGGSTGMDAGEYATGASLWD